MKEVLKLEEQKTRPNILVIMVDQQRYPSVYETKKLKRWCKKNLLAQQWLRKNSMEFLNHYAASTACSPSRTSLYTGQYPSLHGVTQTTGVAKGGFDPDVFWLDPSTVPTMGDYFHAAGYKTFWKGKWHASDEDILIPGTHNVFSSYHPTTGVRDRKKEEVYLKADRLDCFGFSQWLGPEPHGSAPRNSGSSAAFGTSGRDEVYAADTVQLIETLEKNNDEAPWFIMCSFVNPHDIALYGALAALSPGYKFEVDPTLPFIPLPPTFQESLSTKPRAQESYRTTYPVALQPVINNNFYRQLYYSLQKKVDQEMLKVLKALQNSIFSEDTIVVFTSDHGELLGAHGGLYQKWHNMYEESIHVPFIIHSRKLFPSSVTTKMLTSHVDVLPTLLGLAHLNVEEIQQKLSKDHTEVHPFVGRDLTPLLKGNELFSRANEPLYFMTDDEITKGLNQTTITGQSYKAVVQPNHIEAVITMLPTGKEQGLEVWKFGRYFDDPTFWSNPNVSDVVESKGTGVEMGGSVAAVCITKTKTTPQRDEFELYNLTKDPLEEKNFAHPEYATKETATIQQLLAKLLKQQVNQKRLTPTGGTN